MKTVLTWVLTGSALLAPVVHADPARKASGQAVDLDAAARATAALYATPAALAATPAPVTARPLQALAQPAVPTYRPSPLLPEASTVALVNVASPANNEVWVGSYHCELSERVSLRPGAAADQVELQWKNQHWNLRRIESRSGAMRLEDALARVVWIQLANKSMLLDQKQGRRLLDECQHDVQVQTAARMKNNPPPALFDTNGMGR